MRIHILVAFLVLLLGLEAGAFAVGGSKEGVKTDAYKLGEKTFKNACVPCHKKNGSGGLKFTTKGRPSPDFRKPEFWKTRTDSLLRHRIMNGVPKSGMPTFEKVLKPEAIDALVVYLRSRFATADAKQAKKK